MLNLKRIIISGLFLSSCVFADYYTIKSPLIKPETRLVYVQDSSRIDMKIGEDKSVSFEGKVPSWAKNDKYYTGIKTYSLSAVLALHPKGKFTLKTATENFKIETKLSKAEFKTFMGEKELDVYKYKVRTSSLKDAPHYALVMAVDKQGAIWALSIGNDNFYPISKVQTSELSKLLEELNVRPLEVETFDFSTESLYMSYLQDSADEQQRLLMSIEMAGKRNNLIKISLNSKVKVFDPANKMKAREENVGFLADIKGKELVQIKKVQMINEGLDTQWKNNPKKNALIVKYDTPEGEDSKIWSNNKKLQYYGIEGIWYLVTWMQKYDIEEKTFLFMNGAMAIDFTIAKRAKSYEMSKRGELVYRFTLNKKGFITSFEFPSSKQVLKLESVESDSVRENRAFIKDFMREHNIIKIGKK